MRRTLLLLGLIGGLAASPQVGAAPASWASLQLVRGDGRPFDVSQLEGRVVLFVNVASFCSYTVQYADLEALWQRYKDRGLVVVGVPSNQFGGQEPGTDAEIRSFCSTRYGVTFPLLTKQDVNGDTRSPLYRWLVTNTPGGQARDIGWNFEKFVIGRNGEVVSRFPSYVVPTDPKLRAVIEYALASGA